MCQASAFIRDAAGLAYIDDQGRLFPLPEVDEDDENRYCLKANRFGSAKIRTSSLPKCGCCRRRRWRVYPPSANRSGSAVRWSATNTTAAATWSTSSAATVRSNAASATNAAGLVSEYEYDHYTPTGKVLRNWTSLGEEWRFTYHDGYTEVTDVLGRTEQYHYDYNNELTKRVFADSSTNLIEREKLRRGIYKTQSKFVIRYEFGLFCRLKSRVGLSEFTQSAVQIARTSILMKRPGCITI